MYRVSDLVKRSNNNYTFNVQVGQFWIQRWWFNPETGSIVPPTHFVNGKRYPFIRVPGSYFPRLRRLLERMIALGIKAYNPFDLTLLVDDLPQNVGQVMATDAYELMEADEDDGTYNSD